MSGIVSITFCGIAMARYASPNLSENGIKVFILCTAFIYILLVDDEENVSYFIL